MSSKKRSSSVLKIAVFAGAAVAAVACLACGVAQAQDPDDEVVRPFDRVVLKKGGEIVGTIDPAIDPTTAPEIVITSKGGTVKLKSSEIQSITPHNTADDVYRKKKKRIGAIHDASKRAPEELLVGKWCKSPLPQLDGAAPRAGDALGHFLSAVELDPKLAEAYPQILSIVAARWEDPSTATADLDREARVAILAEKGGYADPEIDYRLGSLLAERLGLPGKAKLYLERVVASGHKNQGELKAARNLLARIYREEGAPERAIALYEPMLVQPDTSPTNFEPYFELAKLQSRLGTLDGTRAARELFTKAQAIQPDFLEISAELAALDYRAGNLAAAEKTLKALLAKDATNAAASIDLALVQMRMGRYAIAEKSLKALAPQVDGADKARAAMGLGIISENRGDDLNAVAQYREALAADPGSVEAKMSLAAILVRLGQAADGRALAAELLPQAKSNQWLFAACSRILGEADLAEKKTDSALGHLLRAVEVDSSDPALLERVGALLLRQGKLDQGFQTLLRARQAGGERADTMNAMAFYHYSRGEFDTARQIFESVLKLVPPPPKATGKDAKGSAIPPARLYALRGRELIDDLKRLEMWTADLGGPDAPTLDGWEETERNGIEISRKGGHIVLAGKQSGASDGVTQVMLDRPVETQNFERVSMGARVDSGKVRLALRIEGYAAKGGASTGLIFYKDFDGVLRAQVMAANGGWEAVPRAEDVPPESGKLSNPETASWPADTAFHTLEIRRSGRPPTTGTASAASAARSAPGTFDLYFDGEPVIWNVKVTGLGGKTYGVGLSGQTDAVGNEYSVSVESFKVYREMPKRKSNARF